MVFLRISRAELLTIMRFLLLVGARMNRAKNSGLQGIPGEHIGVNLDYLE
jgi:hypothetical protein